MRLLQTWKDRSGRAELPQLFEHHVRLILLVAKKRTIICNPAALIRFSGSYLQHRRIAPSTILALADGGVECSSDTSGIRLS